MAGEIAYAVAAKVTEQVVDSIVRQFSYLFCYNRNITNLIDGVQDLLNKRAAVQLLVDEAIRNLEVIAPHVEVWLMEVGEIEKKMSGVVEGRERMKNRWCPNLKQRYLLSREAVKQTLAVVELQEQGECYSQFSYPAAPTSMMASTSTCHFEVLESRISKTEEVIEVLKNNKIHKIGICGLGGIGKTQMVKEICRRTIVDNLFDEVAMVVVSRNYDLWKIQDELASNLGLKFDENGTINDRGVMLCKRLMQRRILVIFDDVWEELDFGKLGIPVGGEGESKGCKVLLTSRDEHVCNMMGTQVNFTIQPLSDKEAWNLFKEKAGDCVETSDLHSIAQELVNECRGLPHSIVTVGTMLKNRDKYVWEDTLKKLKTSTAMSTEEMDRKVLRMRYNRLQRKKISSGRKGSKEIQQLFLLCCLFPENYEIPIECLVRYAWGIRLFREVKNLAAARNRTKALVDRLISSTLLLRSDYEGHVKMLNAVRDYGLQEATRGEHTYMVKHNAESNEWLQNVDAKHYTAISFGTKEELLLPPGLVWPKIQLLNLVAKGFTQISRSYFGRMEELRVISLEGQFVDFDFDSEHMPVESPPNAVKFLINVRTLWLESCHISNSIGLVGSLQNLEILSFHKSDIDMLPSEIGKLVNLKLLDLRCELGLIHPGVLSSLIQLEELYMGNYLHDEGGEERNQGYPTIIAELCSLSRLKTLQISVSNQELLLKLKDFPLEELTRFIISKSKYKGNYDGYEFQNKVALEQVDVVSILNTKIRSLMSRTEELKLSDVTGLNNFAVEGFVNLKQLFISDSDDIKEVFSANLPTGSLGRLERIELYKLSSMRHLWGGPHPVNLKSLQIFTCDAIKSLFSPSVVSCLVKLQELRIFKCQVLEEVISKDGTAEDDSRTIEFPKLNHLVLQFVPSLRSFVSVSDICGSENNHDGLSVLNEVLLPSMEVLWLEYINMASIVGAQMPPRSLCKLRELVLRKCRKIVCVAASEAIKQLQNLKKLRVFLCDSVETLFDLEGLGEEVRVLGQLDSIGLQDLSELRHLWKNVPRGLQGFQNLKILEVFGCKMLRYLLSPCIARLLVNLQEMTLKSCEKVEQVIQMEEAAAAAEEVDYREIETEEENFHRSKTEMKNSIVLEEEEKEEEEEAAAAAAAAEDKEEVDFREIETEEEYSRRSKNEMKNSIVLEAAAAAEETETETETETEEVDYGEIETEEEYSRRSKTEMKNSIVLEEEEEAAAADEEVDYGEIETEEEYLSRSKTEMKNSVVFPQLRSLELQRLYNLKVFCRGNHYIEFPSLDKLSISDCPNMKNFPSRLVRVPKLEMVDFDDLRGIPVRELNYMMKCRNEGMHCSSTISDDS
ncbi:hypothetical protein LguiB_012895 [Lonicera macranthoides]